MLGRLSLKGSLVSLGMYEEETVNEPGSGRENKWQEGFREVKNQSHHATENVAGSGQCGRIAFDV